MRQVVNHNVEAGNPGEPGGTKKWRVWVGRVRGSRFEASVRSRMGGEEMVKEN